MHADVDEGTSAGDGFRDEGRRSGHAASAYRHGAGIVDIPEEPLVTEFPQGSRFGRESILQTDLEYLSRRMIGINHGLSINRIARHRFLTDHMFARLQGGNRWAAHGNYSGYTRLPRLSRPWRGGRCNPLRRALSRVSAQILSLSVRLCRTRR